MLIEVVGYKGVVGGATYEWLKTMHPRHEIVGREPGDLVALSDVSFVCVPEAVVEEVCAATADYTRVMVVRSTVVPGTCKSLQMKYGRHVCHNPEFLREATAIQDVFNPSYVLIGACCWEHAEMVSRLYESAQVKTVIVNTTTSEMVKVATNNYLACLVSFWNEMESICQASNVVGHRVGAIASLDPRVVWYGAKYHHQYGGKCLPKEIDQMLAYAREKGISMKLLEAIKEVNQCTAL